jgi:hypothetical protein
VDVWGVFLGFAGGLFVSWLFWKLRQPKRMAWLMKSDTEIVSEAAKNAGSELRVMWGQHVLAQPRLVILRFANTGMPHLSDTDFLEPIVLRHQGTSIKDVTIPAMARKVPEPDVNLTTDTQSGVQEIRITPKYVNRDGWFDVQLVCDGELGPLAAEANIRGETSDIRQMENTSTPLFTRLEKRLLVVAGAAMLAAILLSIGIGASKHNLRPGLYQWGLWIVTGLVSAAGVASAALMLLLIHDGYQGLRWTRWSRMK